MLVVMKYLPEHPSILIHSFEYSTVKTLIKSSMAKHNKGNENKINSIFQNVEITTLKTDAFISKMEKELEMKMALSDK